MRNAHASYWLECQAGGGIRESRVGSAAILAGEQWNDPRKLLSSSPWVGFQFTTQLFIGRNLPALTKVESFIGTIRSLYVSLKPHL